MSDEYTWDRQVLLSQNAKDLLIFLVKEYQPQCEPWEDSLCKQVLRVLET